MLSQTNARSVVAHVIDPVARALLRLGVSPDAVTLVGTVGVSLAALIFFPGGHFVPGVLIIMLFIFSDMLDGTMARMSGRQGPWGAFLDSSLDRVADGFVFGSILIWAVRSQSNATVAAALICLVGGALISYVKARAEGLGFTCNVGIAERTERLILVLLAAFIAGFGVPYVLPGALWILAGLTAITVYQRIAHVRGQIHRHTPTPPAEPPSPEAAGNHASAADDGPTAEGTTANGGPKAGGPQNSAPQTGGSTAGGSANSGSATDFTTPDIGAPESEA